MVSRTFSINFFNNNKKKVLQIIGIFFQTKKSNYFKRSLFTEGFFGEPKNGFSNASLQNKTTTKKQPFVNLIF